MSTIELKTRQQTRVEDREAMILYIPTNVRIESNRQSTANEDEKWR